MIAILAAVIAVVFLFLSNATFAKNFGASFCETADYHCYVVQRGDTWEKLFPNENHRHLVKIVNRMNTPLHKGMKMAVPNNLDADKLDYAPFDREITPTGSKLIMVSLGKLAFGAYDEQGVLQHWGPISGGKGYCADVGRGCRTPTGNFAIYQKRGPGCVSSRFPVGIGGAPMPFCMFFHRGFAMHGSPEVPGYHASHGCVRMFTNDARWLNKEFTADEDSVPVIVTR